ncbi:hypothetical protein BCR44DRAFT_1313888 [Catenaria anguillulae PL171]|uniref:Uncharacterized protein n=1 Tax=Catenaria anguillulae PL171 TaxID=765915 RepID=A0A1Y2H766_9FUNG|nr:hypothetical protein BCR44DRAFT_1313888 [Catenaria anguillulae PL171]
MLATSSRSHHSQGATSAAAAAAKKQFLEKSISLRNREAALASDLDSWVQVHGADIVIDLATSREPAQTVATPGIVKGKRPRRAGKSVPSTVIRFGNSDDTFPQGHARLKSLLHTLYSLQEQQQSQCDNVPLQPTLAEQIHRTFTQFEESLHLAHKALVEESQSLAVQEKQLSHDIAMVEDRLRALEVASTDVTVDCTLPSSFSGVTAASAGKSSSKSRLVPANTLPPEVMEFEVHVDHPNLVPFCCVCTRRSDFHHLVTVTRVAQTFVAKHGPTGGWDPYAHDVFLSTLKHTCPSLLAAITSATDVDLDIEAKVMGRLVSRCAESLGVPESDVEAHCEWWIEWLRLQVRKRKAIDHWRRKKQLQQQPQPVNDAAVQVGLKVGKRSNSSAGVDEEKMTEQMLKVAEWRIEKERQRIREEQAELAGKGGCRRRRTTGG